MPSRGRVPRSEGQGRRRWLGGAGRAGELADVGSSSGGVADPKTGLWGQGSVSVGHEGLLFGEVNLEQFHSTAGALPCHPVTTTDRTPSTNLSGQYN